MFPGEKKRPFRPWEETWSIEDMVGTNAQQLHTPGEGAYFGNDRDTSSNPAEEVARARLAAAAPEMARLLLDIGIDLRFTGLLRGRLIQIEELWRKACAAETNDSEPPEAAEENPR